MYKQENADSRVRNLEAKTKNVQNLAKLGRHLKYNRLKPAENYLKPDKQNSSSIGIQHLGTLLHNFGNVDDAL